MSRVSSDNSPVERESIGEPASSGEGRHAACCHTQTPGIRMQVHGRARCPVLFVRLGLRVLCCSCLAPRPTLTPLRFNPTLLRLYKSWEPFKIINTPSRLLHAPRKKCVTSVWVQIWARYIVPCRAKEVEDTFRGPCEIEARGEESKTVTVNTQDV